MLWPEMGSYISLTMCWYLERMNYLDHLSKDKKLKKVVSKHGTVKLVRRKQIHIHLCGSIMSQQLSTRVAEVIHKRFLNLYKGKPSPQQILDTAFDELRSIGLSNAKTNYVKNVAAFAIERGLDYKVLNKMNDEEVINYLTQIKGVGRWTAEMMLMFALGREDVFAVDDLGIQQAMIRLYDLDHSNKKQFREDMLTISKQWSPYRTYACVHLWQWKDKP
jgi:DNA-3-methyladenine glycosylase II